MNEKDEPQRATRPLLLLTYECQPLAYDLHKFGPALCGRRGGTRVCGTCIKDLYGPVMGFKR